MSGPDERRGTDGGEHPLDVDARFADIVAHFHDGEPAAPELVDGTGGPGERAERPARDDAGEDGVEAATRDAAAAPGGTSPAGRRPGEDDDPTDPADPADLEGLEREARAARAARAARISAEVDRAVDGPDSHYVPADPPPLPRPSDLPGRLAWAGVLLGPLLLLLCALLWRSAPPWLVGTIATAMVAGFVYLVWRLPRTRDRDDPGDGAIV